LSQLIGGSFHPAPNIAQSFVHPVADGQLQPEVRLRLAAPAPHDGISGLWTTIHRMPDRSFTARPAYPLSWIRFQALAKIAGRTSVSPGERGLEA